MPAKAVLLYSGGLDSLLAAKVLMDQGIEVTGFHALLPFISPEADLLNMKPAQMARQIGLKIHFHICGEEYIRMMQNPEHGFGKNANPCIDCKLYIVKKAVEYMNETGADFVATGEVVGQRPMSQVKHKMNLIENGSGIKGRLLRPLSAKILKPTIPEIEGLVDRNRLFGLSGRGRNAQFDLAKQLGIEKYATPAGGCLFTEPNISKRVMDLLENIKDPNPVDFYLLSLGRHYRINKNLKIIVSRNEEEGIELEKYRSAFDSFFIPEFKGALAGAKGAPENGDLSMISSILCRYGKLEEGNGIEYFDKSGNRHIIPQNEPAAEEKLKLLRI